MDTRLLRYFLAVAEHKNFTEAAKHLYMTQSALSHQIINLEKELDAKLFIRTTRSVELTSAGLVLQRSAKDLIAQIDQISNQIRKAESGLLGELRIGSITAPFKKLLPDLLLQFQQKFPDIKVDYVHQNVGALYESLEYGRLDIAFTMSFDLLDSSTIVCKPLFLDGISIAARPDHPVCQQSTIDFSTLSHESFVTLSEKESPRWHKLMIKVCANRDFVPNIFRRHHLAESVLLDVEAGLGIAILPTSITRCYTSDLKFIELDGEDTKFHDVLAWKKDNPNPSIPLFLKMFDHVELDIGQ